MEASYELFDHTADMGVRVRAATMDELVAPAVGGFYATIGEVVAGDDTKPVALNLVGNDAAILLRDFLTELLVMFEREHRCMKSIEHAQLSENQLNVVGTTALVDTERSSLHREVKAVTYHELRIIRTPQGFEATFIVDI